MREKTFTLIILHIAVFLAGWTGIFGRLISLGGLPLVWYRMMASVVVLAAVLACMQRLHRTGWKAVMKICGCGILPIVLSVVLQTYSVVFKNKNLYQN